MKPLFHNGRRMIWPNAHSLRRFQRLEDRAWKPDPTIEELMAAASSLSVTELQELQVSLARKHE